MEKPRAAAACSAEVLRGTCTSAIQTTWEVSWEVMCDAVVASSIPAMLRERASLNPNAPAITYIDYDQEWEGVEETLSWSQLYRRMQNVGEEISRSGSPGDRALILSPQGL